MTTTATRVTTTADTAVIAVIGAGNTTLAFATVVAPAEGASAGTVATVALLTSDEKSGITGHGKQTLNFLDFFFMVSPRAAKPKTPWVAIVAALALGLCFLWYWRK